MYEIKWNNIFGKSGSITLDGKNPFDTYESAENYALNIMNVGKPDRWTLEESEISRLTENSLGQPCYEYFHPKEYSYEILNLDDDYDYQMKLCYEKRIKEYGTISDQLDEIYHNQKEWEKRIKAIKDKHIKPVKK